MLEERRLLAVCAGDDSQTAPVDSIETTSNLDSLHSHEEAFFLGQDAYLSQTPPVGVEIASTLYLQTEVDPDTLYVADAPRVYAMDAVLLQLAFGVEAESIPGLDSGYSLREGRIHIEVDVTDIDARDDLEALGLEVTSAIEIGPYKIVAGFADPDDLLAIEEQPSTVRMRASERGMAASQGTVTNEWEAAALVDQLQRILVKEDEKVDGTGVRIGIISDSILFPEFSGDNLPADFDPDPLDSDPEGTDEGRAMAELVHDIAPGATLLFYTGGNSPADMVNAYEVLRQRGADIIVDDISYYQEPIYQDGMVALKIDEIYQQDGILVLGAAGNNNNEAFEGIWQDLDGDDDVEFAPGNDAIEFTLPAGDEINVHLHWAQPFTNAGSELDIVIYDTNENVVSTSPANTGDIAHKSLQLTNNGSTALDLKIRVELAGGDSMTGTAFRLTIPDGGGFLTQADDEALLSDQPSIAGNHASKSMLTIGAVHHTVTLYAVPESYSARGPVTLLFDPSGNPLSTPEIRNKPEFAGGDGVSTSVAGYETFYGTSAAAPNVAAIAALMLQVRGLEVGLSVSDVMDLDDLKGLLQLVAIEGDPEFDAAIGHGVVTGLGAVMASRLQPNRQEIYAELNPFGNAAYRTTLGSNQDIDSIYFSTDTATCPTSPPTSTRAPAIPISSSRPASRATTAAAWPCRSEPSACWISIPIQTM